MVENNKELTCWHEIQLNDMMIKNGHFLFINIEYNTTKA